MTAKRNGVAKIGGHTLRKVAVAAMTDPRTIQHYFAGIPVKNLSAERIRLALKQLGMPDPQKARK